VPTGHQGETTPFCHVRLDYLNRPTSHIQGEDPWRIPVHPIAHQHGIGARQLSVLEADHQPDFAQPGETYSQGKGPIGVVPYGQNIQTHCSSTGYASIMIHAST